MRFGSAASGIEAASVAWSPLGFESAWFSEIDPFCCSLLSQRWGKTPNLGNMNDITTHALRRCGKLDVVIAGTPCQAFSVAGRRDGITDPRGQLALRLLDLVEYTRPRWFVWENVPGVLSSWTGPDAPSDLHLQSGQRREVAVRETSDLGQFLVALGQLGYGCAYRVYDAQFFGVPQRRRRIFVVGYLGDWRRAAAVLFERRGLPRHPATGSEAKPNIAGTITAGAGRRRGAGVNPSEIVAAHITGTLPSRSTAGGGLGTDFDCDGGLIAHTLRGEGFDASEDGTGRGTPLVPVYAIQEGAVRENVNIGPQGKGYQPDIAYTLEARHHVQAVAYQCHGSNVGPMGTLRAGNGNETGGVPFMVMAHGQAGAEVIAGQSPTLTCNHEAPILFSCKDHGADAGAISPTLRAMGHSGSHANAGGQVAMAFVQNQRDELRYFGGDGQTVGALAAEPGVKQQAYIQLERAVRRLTPRECERLQGFPDDYTLVTHRKKPAADGPRYKAIGNSIAIPVLRWIGQGILENDK